MLKPFKLNYYTNYNASYVHYRKALGIKIIDNIALNSINNKDEETLRDIGIH